jgi:hypothetical protein
LLSFALISVVLYFLVDDSNIESVYDADKAERQWLLEVLPQAIDWVQSQEGKYIPEGQNLTDQEMATAKSMGVLHRSVEIATHSGPSSVFHRHKDISPA